MMKFTKPFLTAVAIIAFTACNNEVESGLVQKDEVRSVSVSLKLPEASKVKSSSPEDVITSNTVDVNTVLINLTDGGGTIIETLTVTKDAITDSDWDKLTDSNKGLKFINTPSSVVKVEIYGNPGTAVSGTNNVVATTVADQQGSEVLYYGYDDDLTPVVSEPINPDPTNGSTYIAEIEIVPIVARFQVNSISFKSSGNFEYSRTVGGIEEKATVTWTGFTADVMGIYFNNFYHKYNSTGGVSDLWSNTTYQGSIENGQWLFSGTDAIDFAAYASYSGGNYFPLPQSTANKTYGFNFFPGTVFPTIHLDLDNVNIVDLESTDDDVFNPSIAEASRFANVVVFYKSGSPTTEMTAADFKAGTIYNMDIEVIPALSLDLHDIQFNVLVKVSIAEWVEETLIPGFNLSE